MVSDKRIVGYLSDGDFGLFRSALKKYKTEQSEFIREIVHAWLFANKLKLENEKSKRKI